jgi:diguanylate cyclase (GGDEF)-like protein/PAS domain S-box-containing protein
VIYSVMHVGKRYQNLKSWLCHATKLHRGRAILAAGSVTGGVMLVRFMGLLQGWELANLDSLVRLRPGAMPDDRIVIIAIDEPDLQAMGQYPIADRDLAQALKIVQAANPRAIGLDIYRDLPVEPGHASLQQVYQTQPNLVGIERLGDTQAVAVPPPARLAQPNPDGPPQVGFNNVVRDWDGTVRRGILYWRTEANAKAKPSFALALALQYLQAEGVHPKPAEDGSGYLQLGRAVFRRFTANTGGYIAADAGGYQVLLNLSGGANSFRRVAFTDVLNGQIAPEQFRDRIVLIGYTASSVNDFVHTAHSYQGWGAPETVPGVELQGLVVSHLVGSAFGEQPLLQTWPDPVEYAWIGFWAIATGCLYIQIKRLWLRLPLFGLLGITLIGSGYALLQIGWWVPVLPPLLAMGGSVLVLILHEVKLQTDLRRSKEFLSSLIHAIPDPVFVKDQQYQWVVLNDAYANFLGYARSDLLNRSDYDVFPKLQADLFRQHDQTVFETQTSYCSDEQVTNCHGRTYQVETKRSLHQDAAGNVFLVGVMRDITERKQLEEDLRCTAAELVESNAELRRSTHHLSHLANHDALTGLPNRKLFYERLGQALERATHKQQLVGVLFIDLDGFKQINDSLGHEIGDFLLQAVSRRLVGCLRSSDTIARVGGDEFIVILSSIVAPQDAARVAEKLLATLANPFAIADHTIAITSSVGISIYPTHTDDLTELVKQADQAMYRAKQRGKSRYEFV